ncbi:MAG: HYR domain-containing protein, partial [Verrucomicrobia bacterium]
MKTALPFSTPLSPNPFETSSRRKLRPALRWMSAALFVLGCFAAQAATLVTDKEDYPPYSVVWITGTGFQPGETVSNQVTQIEGPDAGAAYAPWGVVADTNGNFETGWIVFSDELIGTTLQITGTGQTSGLIASATFKDGVSLDFSQFANETGNVQWINGTLNANNSTYTEGMSVPQRLVINGIPAAPGNCSSNSNYHCLTFKVLATKGGFHAYDFLTSWQQGVQAADQRIAPGLNLMAGLAGFQCGDLGNPEFGICTNLHAMTNVFLVPISGDEISNNVVLNTITNDVGLRITRYENLFGDRTATLYGNAPILNATFTFVGYEPGSGEIYSVYKLCWESASTQFILEVAGHLAQTTDQGQLLSYPDTGGSANINGGPYHFKLVELDCGSTGNKDNQIQGGEIIPQPICAVSVGVTNICPGTSATISGMALAGKAPFTYTWISPENSYTNVISSSVTNVSITVSNPGTYTLYLSDALGLVSPEPCSVVVGLNTGTTANTLTNQFICPGSSASFCVSAAGTPRDATGDFGFVWKKNGAVISSAGNLQITTTASNSCLVITNATGANAATYCVEVTGQCNTVTNCVVLTVSTTPPTIICVPNKSVECGQAWDFDPPTSTNGVISILNTTTNFTGFCGDTFSATRTWVAMNACGLTNTCSQTVTVVDTTPPAINCPTNKTVECTTSWSFDLPTASDLCGTNRIDLVGTVTNAVCGDSFTATRTWRITDACGNQALCNQTVTVVDTTPPEVNCPSNKVISCGQAIDFNPPTANDVCGTNKIVVLRTVTNTAGFCGATFQVTRTWQITDACGNQARCSQAITLIDTNPPTIICPTNLTVQCFGDIPAPDPSLASSSDTCGTVTNSWDGDTYLTNGCIITVTRTYRATDACGNTNTCNQTITVADTIAPQLFGVPTSNQFFSCPSQIPALPVVTATDNCV